MAVDQGTVAERGDRQQRRLARAAQQDELGAVGVEQADLRSGEHGRRDPDIAGDDPRAQRVVGEMGGHDRGQHLRSGEAGTEFGGGERFLDRGQADPAKFLGRGDPEQAEFGERAPRFLAVGLVEAVERQQLVERTGEGLVDERALIGGRLQDHGRSMPSRSGANNGAGPAAPPCRSCIAPA
jgi:hypothetical protein